MPGLESGAVSFGVRRGVAGGALAASAVLGLIVGAGAHWTFGDTAAAGGPGVSSSSESTPGTTSGATTEPSAPMGSATEPESPVPTSVTPSATAITPEAGPPFTSQALLLPDELRRYGWASARVIQSYDENPSPPITPCTTLEESKGAYRTYAAVYASARTTADEVAVRYDTEEHAKAAYVSLRDTIRACADDEQQHVRREVHDEQSVAQASRVDEAMWWRTRDATDASAHGVLGIGRAGDRVLVLFLESDLPGSDPVKTTDIPDLLVQATRRLV